MVRRTARLMMLLAAVAIALLVAPQVASAQETIITPDGDALVYEGPFGNTDDGGDQVLGQSVEADAEAETDVPSTSVDDRSRDLGLSFVVPDVQPGTTAADDGDATVGGTGGGLAVSGSDVEPIVAISVGLLAVGGSALVSSRRRLRDLFV